MRRIPIAVNHDLRHIVGFVELNDEGEALLAQPNLWHLSVAGVLKKIVPGALFGRYYITLSMDSIAEFGIIPVNKD